MIRISSLSSRFSQEKVSAGFIAVMGKKVTMLAVFLLATLLVRAQDHLYHKDENGVIRILYEGKSNDALYFRVVLDNKVEKQASIKLVDENAVVYYNGFYRRKEVVQKLRIESPQDNRFIFKIQRAGEVSPISFEVKVLTTYQDDVQIKPLAEKTL